MVIMACIAAWYLIVGAYVATEVRFHGLAAVLMMLLWPIPFCLSIMHLANQSAD